MFKNLIAGLLLFIAFKAQARENFPVTDTFRMPAEWEKHEAVWVGWELFAPFNQPSLDVIKGLLPFVPVRVVTESSFSAQVAKEWLHIQGVDSSKPVFFVMPDNRIWLRDHGATFLRNEKGELGFADFTWSHYGIRDWLKWISPGNRDIENTYRQAAKRTGSVDSLMGLSQSARRIATDISLEGGGIEVNGKGVLILSEAVTLQRNPGKSKKYIEAELRRVLGANIIIWMKQGLADDPHIIRPITGKYIGFGTGGHTDEFVRFVNDSTILLAWVGESEKDSHPIHRMNFERMSENLRILEEARDQRGRPFRIIRVPLPGLIYKNVLISHLQKNESDDAILSAWLNPQSGFKAGDTVQRVAAASYLNYFVTNGVVLVPTYLKSGSSEEKEEKVRKILEEVFPGRKIIFIDVMALNYEGGGIHCITQQQPF
jgi:agmatine deiminase